MLTYYCQKFLPFLTRKIRPRYVPPLFCAWAPRTTTALDQICTNAAREKPRTIIAEFGKCPIGKCTIFNHVSSECELPPSLPLVAKLSAPPFEHWTLGIVPYGIWYQPVSNESGTTDHAYRFLLVITVQLP